MTVHRAWRHYTGYADADGVLWASSEGVTGDVVISGGGFAEPVAYGVSSTSTSTENSHGMCPLVGMYSEYSSAANQTFLSVGFAAAPYSRLSVHIFTTWES